MSFFFCKTSRASVRNVAIIATPLAFFLYPRGLVWKGKKEVSTCAVK